MTRECNERGVLLTPVFGHILNNKQIKVDIVRDGVEALIDLQFLMCFPDDRGTGRQTKASNLTLTNGYFGYNYYKSEKEYRMSQGHCFNL